jgi:hypothetical protein
MTTMTLMTMNVALVAYDGITCPVAGGMITMDVAL